MSEKSAPTVRPTKKQKELLAFIEDFIATHGYSPSYREIMGGLHYNSVATVSLHINNLIRRGHLQKRDKSARSLEVISHSAVPLVTVEPKQLKASEEKWLVGKVEMFFREAEKAGHVAERDVDRLYVLTGALKVLGLDGAASSFIARLSEIKKKQKEGEYVA